MDIDLLIRDLVMASPLGQIPPEGLEENILPEVERALLDIGVDDSLEVFLDGNHNFKYIFNVLLKTKIELRRKLRELRGKDLDETHIKIGLSLFGYIESQLYLTNRSDFLDVFGITVDSKEMDTNHFAGLDDYSILNFTPQGKMYGAVFSTKAQNHLERSMELWELTKHAHRKIAFRQARASGVYLALSELTDSEEFLRESYELSKLGCGLLNLSVPERDTKFVEKIRDLVLDEVEYRLEVEYRPETS